MLAACATPSAPGFGAISSSSIAERRLAEKEVEESRRTIDAGSPSEAIPRLLYVLSAYPETPGAIEAHYWLGVAYDDLNGFKDAADSLQEYLRLAPDGPRAEEAAARLRRISEKYAAQAGAPEELDRQISEARARLQGNPANAEARMQLAEALWRRGNYTESAQIYVDLAKEDPALAQDPVVRERVELLADGGYTVLTPAEVQRRQAEANPVVVLNTASFRAGRDLLTQVPRFYVVTGHVLNQSDRVLYGVSVFVTIYGFGQVVYDTATAHIGRLNPGEMRAFNVRFSNFESIESISRYECVPTYQR